MASATQYSSQTNFDGQERTTQLHNDTCVNMTVGSMCNTPKGSIDKNAFCTQARLSTKHNVEQEKADIIATIRHDGSYEFVVSICSPIANPAVGMKLFTHVNNIVETMCDAGKSFYNTFHDVHAGSQSSFCDDDKMKLFKLTYNFSREETEQMMHVMQSYSSIFGTVTFSSISIYMYRLSDGCILDFIVNRLTGEVSLTCSNVVYPVNVYTHRALTTLADKCTTRGIETRNEADIMIFDGEHLRVVAETVSYLLMDCGIRMPQQPLPSIRRCQFVIVGM